MVVPHLLGPAGGEEELGPNEDRVRERYLVGMLAPRRARVPAETLDDPAQAGADSTATGRVTLVTGTTHPLLLLLLPLVLSAAASIRAAARA